MGAWCPLPHSEVVLWDLLSIHMFLWWICGGESGLPILFLHHLRTASKFILFKTIKFAGISHSSQKKKTFSSILIHEILKKIFFCNVVLAFTAQLHTYPLPPMPPLPQSHPSRSSQSARLDSLCCTAASQQPSILRLIVYTCCCYFPHSSPPSLPYCVHNSVLYVWVSVLSLQIVSSVPFF